MTFSFAKSKLPSPTNLLLAILSAILLILAFPNFDLWFCAWFALVPIFFAIEREKDSAIKSFILGWVFGTLFFSGSCWWLTYSFTHYGGIPSAAAYLLLFIITGIVAVFPAMFAAAFSVMLKRFGTYGILSAPFLWTAQEFLRAGLADTSWNVIGYSQAFQVGILKFASVGGVYLIGFFIVAGNSFLVWISQYLRKESNYEIFAHLFFHKFSRPPFAFGFPKYQKDDVLLKTVSEKQQLQIVAFTVIPIVLIAGVFFLSLLADENLTPSKPFAPDSKNIIVVVQANVPMSNLNEEKWLQLRQRHVELAEAALQKLEGQRTTDEKQTTVIFPESPMNFSYGSDKEFRTFIGEFARKHNVSVLFNSAEPNPNGDNYFNSAIMVNADGAKIGQYDKIHLVPFGEYAPVPAPIKPLIPTLVGSFQPGENYDLFPIGDAQAGIMICYESHFPSLSREFAKRGADVLIEMTNDGYLGDTGVLRQHLAGAIFRAVETNRPVLRATNVGITAYINERGEVSDAADVYTEATRIWTVGKSDGKQTFYVRFGDWFAWLCSLISLVLLMWNLKNLTQRRKDAKAQS